MAAERLESPQAWGWRRSVLGVSGTVAPAAGTRNDALEEGGGAPRAAGCRGICRQRGKPKFGEGC